MSLKRPLVLSSGKIQQLQSGDTLDPACGPITGLTAGYVPYAMSSTVVANSGIFFSPAAMQVGIGTVSPTVYTMLDIVGIFPGIRQSIERTGGGVDFSIFMLSALNTTTGLRTQFGSIGAVGLLNSGTTPPTCTAMYFGADTDTSLSKYTIGLFPGQLTTFAGPTGIGLPHGYTASGLLHFDAQPWATYANDGSKPIILGTYGLNTSLLNVFCGTSYDLAICNPYSGGSNGGLHFLTGGSVLGSANERLTILKGGAVGVGVTAPTARLHLQAGSATASTAPLKLTSGVSLTTAEVGAVEFTTDNLYFTITTGAARKGVVLNDGSNLTSGAIPIASTNGRLIDGPTPLAGTKVYYVSDTSGGATTRKLTFTNGILTSET